MGWIKKAGYETLLLASGESLDSPGTEVQLVSFSNGKDYHYHAQKTELFYFLEGSGIARLDGAEQRVTAGDLLIIEPGTRHAFSTDSTDHPLKAIMVKTNSSAKDTFR